ncbi:MAG TPA: PorP/SprF family type IX secretion system membrane protein [Bacteroidia bacterium]|jgi:type IX secretion system PorP/SprF family membrane protein|nr:PorP/SprF family type IX secretion system membrane protein [Bacteroidia bacterium]
MNRITCCFFTALTVVAISSSVHAQDIHFSQFYEYPLSLNPALCGAFDGDVYAEANYRSQWGSVMGSGVGYNTMGATVELHNMDKKWSNGYISPGLSFYNDKSGDAQIGVTEVDFTLASGVFLSTKSSLSAGLQAGWAQHSINMTSLQWDNQYINGQYDPNAPTGETTVGNSFSYVDFSAGMAYSYGTGQTNMTANDQFKANVGAAVFHVNQPNMSYYGQTEAGTKLYMRYVFHGDVQFGIQNSNISLIPAFAYFSQGPASEFDAGLKIRYVLKQESKYTGFSKGSAFDLGGYYRVGDAIALLTQLEFGCYSIGISYDVNVSQLTSASSGKGGFEISLRFLNPNPFLSGTNSGGRSMF